MKHKTKDFGVNFQNNGVPFKGTDFYSKNGYFCNLFRQSCIDGGKKGVNLIKETSQVFHSDCPTVLATEIIRNSIIDELRYRFKNHFFWDRYNSPYLTNEGYVIRLNRYGNDKKLLILPITERKKALMNQEVMEFGGGYDKILHTGYSLNENTFEVNGIFITCYLSQSVIDWTIDITDIGKAEEVDYSNKQMDLELPKPTSRRKVEVKIKKIE